MFTPLRGGGLHGGKAIASGSYGCVFAPALACASGAAPSADTVSKLLPTQEATNEYEETTLIRAAAETLDTVAQDLLIVPTQPPCTPAPPTAADLVDYDAKCSHIAAASDLTFKLYNFRVLTQKFGGRSLADLPIQTVDDATFARITAALIELMYVIRRVNLRGVVHGDIKDGNVVFRADDDKARLIDWGFCRTIVSEYHGEAWETRFGSPIVMFNCIPSLCFYHAFLQGSRPATVASANALRASPGEWVHRVLQRNADLNKGHLKGLDATFRACFSALLSCGHLISTEDFEDSTGTAFPPIRFSDGTQLSNDGTSILMAHGLAFITAILGAPNSTPDTHMANFYTLVDLVFRVNIDLFGIMACFFECSTLPRSARKKSVFARLAPYVLNPKYAVAPFPLPALVADMRGIMTQSVPTTLPPDFDPDLVNRVPPYTAFSAAEIHAFQLDIDPRNLRAFPSEPYINAFQSRMTVTEPTRAQQADEVRAAGIQLQRAEAAPPAAPPVVAPPVAPPAVPVMQLTPLHATTAPVAVAFGAKRQRIM